MRVSVRDEETEEWTKTELNPNCTDASFFLFLCPVSSVQLVFTRGMKVGRKRVSFFFGQKQASRGSERLNSCVLLLVFCCLVVPLLRKARCGQHNPLYTSLNLLWSRGQEKNRQEEEPVKKEKIHIKVFSLLDWRSLHFPSLVVFTQCKLVHERSDEQEYSSAEVSALLRTLAGETDRKSTDRRLPRRVCYRHTLTMKREKDRIRRSSLQ